MKRTTLVTFAVVLAAACMSFTANAQWEGKGTKNLNLGVGLGSTIGGGFPIGASYDVGFNENISIGGYAGFASYNQDLGFFKYSYTNILIGARGLYHLPLVDGFDTYGGLMLGYNVASAKADVAGAPKVSAGGFLWGGDRHRRSLHVY